MDYNTAFNQDVQELYINCLLGDPTAFTLARNIINEDYFADTLRPTVRFVLDYADEFKAVPLPAQVKAKTGFAAEPFVSDSQNHRDWFLKEVESFCRYKALELAILDGVELLQKGNGGEVEKRVRDAMTISLMSDLGTDYFADPRTRMQQMLDKSSFISTGWEVLDHKLYGGFVKGALNVFAGGSGSGKSLFLQNLAINWSEAGMDVIYFTLELSEALCCQRLDAMISGKGTSVIYKDLDETSRIIAMKGQKSGKIFVKAMPQGGTTANDLRAFLKEYEIQTGRKVKAILVDYLDLMYPNSRSVNGMGAFDKDKATSEELRGLATEMDLLCATASQLNRSSVEAAGEFDHSHIAGGISKINTADNLFGIYTNPSMKERGEYKLQLLKTRTSAATGQTIELGYDSVTMRISDPLIDSTERQTPLDELRRELKAKTKPDVRPEISMDADDVFGPEAPVVKKTSVLDLVAQMSAAKKIPKA